MSPGLRRPWPIGVRRVRAEDRAAVLRFASTTWDGWDYIPEVWQQWLSAPDGAFLAASPRAGATGEPPCGADGAPLDGSPVAIARVTLLSAQETWLEGIRVAPSVHGMDVATDLQVALLAWAAASGASVVRYLTSARNEASLRLGARHGLLPIGCWRHHGRRDDAEAGDQDEGVAGADSAEAGTSWDVAAALAAAETAGAVLRPDADSADWWARVAADATFLAGRGLYEGRSWCFQELTRERFDTHVRASEVLALAPPGGSSPWAALLIDRATGQDEGELRSRLLVGHGDVAARLLAILGGTDGPLTSVRLPDPAPLLTGHEQAFRAAGYLPSDHAAIVVERALGGAHPPPAVDHRRLVLEDSPAPLHRPPRREIA